MSILRCGSLHEAYSYVYGRFQLEDQRLYDKKQAIAEGLYNTPFTKLHRLKLVYYILQGSPSNGGCDIPIHDLLFHGKLAAFFPLHDKLSADSLVTAALHFCTLPWTFPIEDIKAYFGEKYAMYFE